MFVVIVIVVIIILYWVIFMQAYECSRTMPSYSTTLPSCLIVYLFRTIYPLLLCGFLLNPLEVLLGFQIPANFPDTLFFSCSFPVCSCGNQRKYFYDIKKLKFIKNVFRQRKYKLLYLGRMRMSCLAVR